jgi:hypothetical protein
LALGATELIAKRLTRPYFLMIVVLVVPLVVTAAVWLALVALITVGFTTLPS